jgi:hypothetical protein
MKKFKEFSRTKMTFFKEYSISHFGVEEGTGAECRNINLIKKQTPPHERSHLN